MSTVTHATAISETPDRSSGGTTHRRDDLPLTRLYAMRAGYLLMAVGLALVKWPLLPAAHTMPLFEGVTLCILTAMSILALVGLRHPVRMLPLLVLETVWKVLWLGLVALPRYAAGDIDASTAETALSCSLVLLIIAVVPWRHVWRTYAGTPGDRWRASGRRTPG